MEVPSLDSAIVSNILAKTDVSCLNTCKVVCKAWNEVLQDDQVVVQSFLHTWGLAGIRGNPVSHNYLMDMGLKDFVHCHAVRRSDTLVGVAVRYKVDLLDIRRANNLTSDLAIRAYPYLYVPVWRKEDLRGCVVRFLFTSNSRRQMAVLMKEEELEKDGTAKTFPDEMSEEDIRKLRIIIMQEGLNIDACTASYYLEEHGGDIRRAASEFRTDEAWMDGGERRSLLADFFGDDGRSQSTESRRRWRACCEPCCCTCLTAPFELFSSRLRSLFSRQE